MGKFWEEIAVGLAQTACLLAVLLGVRWWFGQDIAVLVGMVGIMNLLRRVAS